MDNYEKGRFTGPFRVLAWLGSTNRKFTELAITAIHNVICVLPLKRNNQWEKNNRH